MDVCLHKWKCRFRTAVLALIALGYRQIDAHKAVRDLQEKGEAKSAQELVKLALQRMASGR